MNKSRFFLSTSFAFALLAMAALSIEAQTVSGFIGKGSVGRGRSVRGAIVLNIPGGLHVNSNRPDSEYSIPTTVRVSTAGGARVSGVTYPRGKDRKFQFSPDTINVYEGRVSFPFTVTVPRGFRGNVVRVTATVRYQACTDEVCYQPRTKTITLSARVR
jgi:DsbC/DsbD-like thiol-disulfide interchange protein